MKCRTRALLQSAMAVGLLSVLLPAAQAAPGPVTVWQEEDGLQCDRVSPGDSSEFPLESSITGGCVQHVVNHEGMVLLTAHVFGIESLDSGCDTEYDMRIGGNGEGYFTNIELTGPACDRQPCGTAAQTPEAWEIHIDEYDAGTERIERHFCLENIGGGGGRVACHYFAPVADPGDHSHELGSVNASDSPTEIACEGFTSFRGEVSGHWVTEGDDLEFSHTS